MLLLSGGTGGLGLLTATWLAQGSTAGLVLTGRTGRLARPEDLKPIHTTHCLVTIVAGDSAVTETAHALVYAANQHGLHADSLVHAAGIQVRSAV